MTVLQRSHTFLDALFSARKLSEFSVKPEHVHKLDEIGEGQFGRVFRATVSHLRNVDKTTIVAVKYLKDEMVVTGMLGFCPRVFCWCIVL